MYGKIVSYPNENLFWPMHLSTSTDNFSYRNSQLNYQILSENISHLAIINRLVSFDMISIDNDSMVS